MNSNTYKIMLFSIAALFMLSASFMVVTATDEVQAESGEGICGDGVSWYLEDGVLTISKTGPGSGAIFDCMGVGAPWAGMDVSTVIINEGVTAIGNVAFGGTDITSVSFPSTLKSIEKYAFIGTALESVVLPSGIEKIGEYSFAYCDSLKSVTIPSAPVVIENGAFYGCGDLEAVDIADGAKSVSWNSFGNCYSLRHVAILDKDTVIDMDAFNFSVSFYDGNGNRIWPEDLAGYTYEGTDGELYRLESRGIDSTGVCGDGLIWTLYTDGSLIIAYDGIGTGVMTDFTSDNKPGWYGKDVLSVTICDGVKTIGNYAFRSCKSLDEVSIAGTVESIGEGSFQLCTSLVSLDLPASVVSIGYEAFLNCYSLVSVWIAGPMQKIEEAAFYGCGLVAIDIPASVEVIDEMAFAACDSLKQVIMHPGVKSIGACAFSGCFVITYIVIPSTVEELGDYLFDVDFFDADGITMLEQSELPGYTYESVDGKLTRCPERDFPVDQGICGDGVLWAYYDDGTLVISYSGEGTGVMFDYDSKENKTPWYANENYTPKSIIVEEGVTALGSYALAFCGAATSIQLPSSLVSMGDHVFYGCASMKTFDFPENVDTIPDYAFAQWMSLRSITIPSSIKYIGKEVFDMCMFLKEVKLSEGLISIGERAFFNSDITTITLPSTLETISDEAFYMCSSLSTVNFSEGLRYIGEKAFYWAEIETLDLPYGLVYIGKDAFSSCSDVTRLTIPSSVAVICEGAFDFFFEEVFYDEDGETVLSMEELPGYVYEGKPMDHKFVRTAISIDGTGSCGDDLKWTFYGISTLEIERIANGSGKMYDYTAESPAPWNSYGFQYITIWEGVTYIGSYAFTDLSNVYMLDIRSDVESIGSDAFVGAEFYLDGAKIRPTAYNLAGKVWTSDGDAKFYYNNQTMYEIKFDATGGNCDVDALWTDFDHFLPYLPDADKDGYRFLGWFTAEVGGEQITESTVFDGDTTVYAQWAPDYTIPQKIVIVTVIGIVMIKELFRWL